MLIMNPGINFTLIDVERVRDINGKLVKVREIETPQNNQKKSQ